MARARAGPALAAARRPEGSVSSLVGIVRPPYPSASARRPAVVPRGVADVTASGGTTGVGGTVGQPAGSNLLRVSAPEADPIRSSPASVDVAGLGASVGRTVRVGGVVVEVGSDAIRLDDGTGQVWVLLRGGAAELLGVIRPDDAVVAIGTVEATADGPRLVAPDPAGRGRGPRGGVGRGRRCGGSPPRRGRRRCGRRWPSVRSPSSSGWRAWLVGASASDSGCAGGSRHGSPCSADVRGARRTHARLSMADERGERVDAREKGALSSPEFRASEASAE